VTASRGEGAAFRVKALYTVPELATLIGMHYALCAGGSRRSLSRCSTSAARSPCRSWCSERRSPRYGNR